MEVWTGIYKVHKSLEIKEISKDVEIHENVKKEDQEQDELLETDYALVPQKDIKYLFINKVNF